MRLLGKALSERHQQLDWTSEPNLRRSSAHTMLLSFLRKPTRVCESAENPLIGLADMLLIRAHFLVHDPMVA